MKSVIRKILLGDTTVTEYSTVTIPGTIREQVLLEQGASLIDISAIHWLLCLDPVVFGIWLPKDTYSTTPDEQKDFHMYFCDSFSNDFTMSKRRAVAMVALNYFDKIDEQGGTLYLLKLVKSKIHHINFIKTFAVFNKYYKKPRFSFQKYKSLVAAYSYPRRVRIISFKQDDYFNIFPMDLLGNIPAAGKQVFGLRHTNATLAKIIEAKQIVVSEVPYLYKDIIYELGKHHGGNPPSPASLPFRLLHTENFGFLIPEWAESYKEIQLLETKSLGSHMLLWGNIINEKTLNLVSGQFIPHSFFAILSSKIKRNGLSVGVAW